MHSGSLMENATFSKGKMRSQQQLSSSVSSVVWGALQQLCSSTSGPNGLITGYNAGKCQCGEDDSHIQRITLPVLQRCPYDRHFTGDSPDFINLLLSLVSPVLEPLGIPDEDARLVENP